MQRRSPRADPRGEIAARTRRLVSSRIFIEAGAGPRQRPRQPGSQVVRPSPELSHPCGRDVGEVAAKPLLEFGPSEQHAARTPISRSLLPPRDGGRATSRSLLLHWAEALASCGWTSSACSVLRPSLNLSQFYALPPRPFRHQLSYVRK